MSAAESRSPDESALSVLGPMLLQALSQGVGGASLGETYAAAKSKLRGVIRRDPIDANLSFILGASALFYFAEKDVNPKVRTYFDALVYTTTCLSVGYADIFARTETGKLVGSIIMTVGPALSGMLLDRPSSEPDPNARIQAAILEKLEAILAEMKKANAG
jgi:hypothetical protein